MAPAKRTLHRARLFLHIAHIKHHVYTDNAMAVCSKHVYNALSPQLSRYVLDSRPNHRHLFDFLPCQIQFIFSTSIYRTMVSKRVQPVCCGRLRARRRPLPARPLKDNRCLECRIRKSPTNLARTCSKKCLQQLGSTPSRTKLPCR